MNHKKGDFVPIDGKIYVVTNIKDGFLELRIPLSRGPPRKMAASVAPYFEGGVLIEPSKQKPSKKYGSTVNIVKVIKGENPKIQMSRQLVAFIHENIETIILNAFDVAKDNAKTKGHKKIRPSHWCWIDVDKEICQGFWPEHNNYVGGNVGGK